MYRETYMEVYLESIKNNINKIINKYNNYSYYFGVVKASCYGLGNEVVKTIVEEGCNYLAVSSLEEALEVRKINKTIPILCFGIIDLKYLDICIENNITITVSNIDYLNELLKLNPSNLKVHLKLNTGMNRLGLKKQEEVTYAYNALLKSSINLEGIYSHIYNSSNEQDTNKQYEYFEYLTKNIDLSKIKIVHIDASTSLISYPKRPYCNGCRLGIIMYGLEDSTNTLESVYKLKSKVIQINEIENESVGYNGTYKTDKKELIAVILIGYADGFIRKHTNSYVYINNKKYQIVGNICMDMMFVKVDETVKVNDEVELIKDNNHIYEIVSHLDTISYELACTITRRVPRIYK